METFVRSRGAPPVLSSSTTSTPSFSFSHTCTRVCVCAHALRFFLPCPSPLATPLLLLLLLRFFSLRAQCRHICIFIRECNRRARFSPLVARYRGKNSRKMAERFEADMRSDFLRSPPLFSYRYLRENNNVSSSTTADLCVEGTILSLLLFPLLSFSRRKPPFPSSSPKRHGRIGTKTVNDRETAVLVERGSFHPPRCTGETDRS